MKTWRDHDLVHNNPVRCKDSKDDPFVNSIITIAKSMGIISVNLSSKV